MKYNIIILLTVIFFSLIGCGDTPVFDEMATNRLTVVIKGTLETEDTSQFVDMNTSFTSDAQINSSPLQDDSVDDVQDSSTNPNAANGKDALPATFMLDIAELRLDKHKFANYRTIIEASLDGDGASEPFFNGEGIVLKNDDPGEGNYDSIKVYIRKMVFDNAMIYQSTGNTLTYEEPAEVIFHENDVNGFDFNQLQVNSYWDSLRLEGGETLRNFPLVVPIVGGMDYNKDNEETVLEIRLVIKNFVKKYEYDYYDDGVFKVCHYYALSDWLRDVRFGENDIGRNIHAVARAYVPGKTGAVTVTNIPNNYYVIAIPESEPITDYFITDTGVNLRNANDCDLPNPPSYPGEYIEAVLDYYLKYEKYKNDFNAQIYNVATNPTGCRGFDSASGTPNYTDEWDIYENSVENFKIAPYVAYSGLTTSVTFSNMAPGNYKFYRIALPASYGTLFSGAAPFTDHNSEIPVTVTVGTNPDITFIP